MDKTSLCFFSCFFFCFWLCLLTPAGLSLSPEGQILLLVKKSIVNDPFGSLSDWSEQDSNPCSWRGVTCDPPTASGGRVVVGLNLSGDPSCGWPPPGSRAAAPLIFSSKSNVSGESGGGWPFSLAFPSCPVLRNPSRQSFRGLPESVPPSLSVPAPDCTSSGVPRKSLLDSPATCGLSGMLSPLIGNLTGLRALYLPFNRFSGPIPESIVSLPSLKVLDLTGNRLSGTIPPALGGLRSLRALSLAYNALGGEIPPTLSGLGRLETLNLAGNKLVGRVPGWISSFPFLRVLSLSHNGFDETIPPELVASGGCQSLEYLDLSGNFLTGTIPFGLGNCTRLRSLRLSSNSLSGTIPRDIGKLERLELLDVSRNSLGGGVPSELGNCLYLTTLVLTNLLDIESCSASVEDAVDGNSSTDKDEFNLFLGELPESILTLPRLRLLWAPSAGLTGALLPDLSKTPSKTLRALNLAGNSFSGPIPTGLAYCPGLLYLDLSSNRLDGTIPPDLPIACFLIFNVSHNSLVGAIPDNSNTTCALPASSSFPTLDETVPLDFGLAQLYLQSFYCGNVRSSLPLWSQPPPNTSVVFIHDLSVNNFSGAIPSLLLGMPPLPALPLGTTGGFGYALFLSGNRFGGAIPVSLFARCEAFEILLFDLSSNGFTGAFPAGAIASSCANLRHLDASANTFAGTLLSDFASIKSLYFLALGSVRLGGRILPEIQQLRSLEYLILPDASLAGDIPEQVGELTSLVVLDLSRNRLAGEIPSSFSNLTRLEVLLLSDNNLSGRVPPGFANLVSLTQIDFSNNNLSGKLPKIGQISSPCTGGRFKGNRYLLDCLTPYAPAESPQIEFLPHLNRDRGGRGRGLSALLVAVVVSASIAGSATVLGFLCLYARRRMTNGAVSPPGNREVITFGSLNLNLTFEGVVKATGNFSVDNLIGTGGFGATYKAEISPGTLVAVKRLSVGRFQGVQQFDAEIRTLGRIRHPLLVTLLGYHASDSEMFLIYNYLSGGNLESLIHDSRDDFVKWKVRYKIALDVAQALAYLHNDCTPRVLHRDIKPSNILLDTSLNAYLSDFGLARLLGASETHATTDVAGTFGYVAPEYAMTCRVSDKADVYSYGVVLLELLSGKKALDPSFSHCGDGFNIVAWASQKLQQGKAREVFAPGLWEQSPRSELVHALKLAVACTLDSLSIRPTMRKVLNRLKQFKISASL